jgi:hypothetical protein
MAYCKAEDAVSRLGLRNYRLGGGGGDICIRKGIGNEIWNRVLKEKEMGREKCLGNTVS